MGEISPIDGQIVDKSDKVDKFDKKGLEEKKGEKEEALSTIFETVPSFTHLLNPPQMNRRGR